MRRGGPLPERALRGAGALALCLLVSACRYTDLPGPDLERMIDQERYEPYEASEYFDDGRAMRTPPEDTVPQGRESLDPVLADGVVSGTYVDRIPVPVTRDLLVRGQNRFEIFCAPCHGVKGDGASWVARKMELRKPPSLIDARTRAFPPGRVYHVVQAGYGLMRPYAEDLGLTDRWAVVAYVRALQRATEVPLDALPAPLRQRAEEELR